MHANRGKYAEGKFRDACKSFQVAEFNYHRYPDAHGGSRVAAPADFMTLYKGTMNLVEVKETEQERRLPYGNFAPDQIARMRAWGLAGARGFVVVYHAKTKLYRLFDLLPFHDRDESRGSWFFEDPPKGATLTESILVSKSIKDIFNAIHNI